MTNEHIVEQIKQGYSTVKNLQWLYEKNLTLIKKIVLPYTKYEDGEDLLQEAYFGLYDAVQHYESDKEVKFMSYAQYWIKQRVYRYIETCGSLIRIPSGMNEKLYKYKKTFSGLCQSMGRMPTNEELAKALRISVKEVLECAALSQGVESLDIPNNDDNESTLLESLESSEDLENNVLEKVYHNYEKTELWNIVENVTSLQEQQILKKIFIEQWTLKRISDVYSIPVRDVRKMKAQGIRKLALSKNKRRIQERLEITESSMYRTSMRKFIEYGDSSVEYMAITRAEMTGQKEKGL